MSDGITTLAAMLAGEHDEAPSWDAWREAVGEYGAAVREWEQAGATYPRPPEHAAMRERAARMWCALTGAAVAPPVSDHDRREIGEVLDRLEARLAAAEGLDEQAARCRFMQLIETGGASGAGAYLDSLPTLPDE